MSDLEQEDDGLEALFAKARATPPTVPDALMARVLSDAVTVQPRSRRGWRAGWRALGGAPGLGGLVTATCVGFWLGVAPPASLPDYSGQLLGGADTAALTAETYAETEPSGFGWDFEEGEING